MINNKYLRLSIIINSIVLLFIIINISTKNEIKLKHRSSINNSKKYFIDSVGGAYKPDISEPPVQYFDYIINKGESLFSISQKINVDEMTILKLNDIKVASLLKANNCITLSSIDGVVLNIVNFKELENIAKKYNIELSKIIYTNNIDETNKPSKIILSGLKYDPIEKSLTMGVYFRRPAYGRLTSYFGYRRDPWSGIRSFHTGVDIANYVGTSVYSAAYGTVVDVSWSWIFGNTITISHYGGYTTFYAHLDKVNVKVGYNVTNQTIIGNIGNTGRTTGSHLHYEVRRYGKLVNPFSVTLFR